MVQPPPPPPHVMRIGNVWMWIIALTLGYFYASFHDSNSGNGRRNLEISSSEYRFFLAHTFGMARGHYLPQYEMEWRNWKAAEWPSKCTWILGSDGLSLHIKVWPSISITFYLTFNSRYIFFASDTSTSDGSPPEQVTKTLAEKY